MIEVAGTNYSAYVPDLPECVAVGDTVEGAEREIAEAIEFRIEGLREDGLPILEPQTVAEYVPARAAG